MSEALSLDDYYDEPNNNEKQRESMDSEERARRGDRESGEKETGVVVTSLIKKVLSERKEDKKRGTQRKQKKSSRKATRRSPSYNQSDSDSRSRSSRRSREKSVGSSSRGTYDGFEMIVEDSSDFPFTCKTCRRGFYTSRDLAEHEIRSHEGAVRCAVCDKEAVSVQKLAAHTLFRHGSSAVSCHYCRTQFHACATDMDRKDWEAFKTHVFKEVVKRRQSELSSSSSSRSSVATDTVALRGVGRCPHGAAVKCKNFPNCPGAKCIYSHGVCRYDVTCNKVGCPFDHFNRPRTCMACVNDLKGHGKRRY